jgi:hypothetical protein
MNQKIKNLILNGLIVLITIGYLYYGTYPKHEDFWGLNLVSQAFGNGHYDFYDYMINIVHAQNFIIYPPNFYVIQGTYLKILSIIFSMPINTWNLFPAVGNVQPWFFPFFGILPNIVVFFIGGYLIYRMYYRKELVVAYLASSFAFISIEIMGQVDVYAMFFILLALYFAKKSFEVSSEVTKQIAEKSLYKDSAMRHVNGADKIEILKTLPWIGVISKFNLERNNQKWKLFSIISLGIGVEFKTYPLLLLIPLAMILANKNIMQTLKYLILGVVVSFITWLPYLKWFDIMTFNRESVSIFDPIWIVGYVALLLIAVIYLKSTFRNLVGVMFLICSWFFTSMILHTNPQWWIWLLPISILVFAEFETKLFAVLYAVLNILFVFYPMRWTDTKMLLIIRNYIPDVPVTGTNAYILVSLLALVLLSLSVTVLIGMSKLQRSNY